MSPTTTESLPVIDPGRAKHLAETGTEEECRRFGKKAIEFLARAQVCLKRLRYLEASERFDDIGKVCGLLRKECEQVGALRMAAACKALKKGPFAGQLDLLEEELSAAERRLAEISRSLGVAVASRGRTRKRRSRPEAEK